jgi:hypothetical protein
MKYSSKFIIENTSADLQQQLEGTHPGAAVMM